MLGLRTARQNCRVGCRVRTFLGANHAGMGFALLLLLAGCFDVNGQDPEPYGADSPPSEPDPATAQEARESTTTSGTSQKTATASATPSASPTPPVPANATNETTAQPWNLMIDGWAPLGSATIRPGLLMGFQGSGHGQGCVANFLFTNLNGTKAYLGGASHCHHNIDNDSVCGAPYVPITNVTAHVYLRDPTDPTNANVPVSGPGLPPEPPTAEIGKLVYASFVTMRDLGETDQNTCASNDFSLVELYPEFARQANPALWHFGGPSALDVDGAQDGDPALTFSDSVLRSATPPLKARSGHVVFVLEDPQGPWRSGSVFAEGCVPGDSGSPVLNEDGTALGVLNRGAGAYCQVSYLAPMLDYMATHGGPTVVLATAPLLTTLPV